MQVSIHDQTDRTRSRLDRLKHVALLRDILPDKIGRVRAYIQALDLIPGYSDFLVMPYKVS